jgi:hypothetical protein
VDQKAFDWYESAVRDRLRPLGDAESDFNAAYRGGNAAAIARACENLARAAQKAESWSAAHRCPSESVEGHLKGEVAATRLIVRTATAYPVSDEVAERGEFRIADLQHKLLWHRDAIAAWGDGTAT